MTAIGKMLVFLILVLSLIWNFLVLNAYTARTNWQREAKKYQIEAVAAAESANKMKALRDVEAESADDAKRSLQQGSDRYYTQLDQLYQARATLNAQYNTAFSDAQKKAAAAAQQQANNEKLSGQVTELDNQLKKKEEQVAQLVTAANLARADMERAKLEAAAFKRASEANQDRVQKLQEEIAEAKLGGSGIPGVRSPAAPVGYRGTITYVEQDKTGVLIEFGPGLDAKLQKGTVLQVNRLTPTGRYLGKLTVIFVNTKQAVGQFEPATRGTVPAGEALPKVGDQVSSN